MLYCFIYVLMHHNRTILYFVYLIFMSQIVLYFPHSISALSLYIDVVLTLSVNREMNVFMHMYYSISPPLSLSLSHTHTCAIALATALVLSVLGLHSGVRFPSNLTPYIDASSLQRRGFGLTIFELIRKQLLFLVGNTFAIAPSANEVKVG